MDSLFLKKIKVDIRVNLCVFRLEWIYFLSYESLILILNYKNMHKKTIKLMAAIYYYASKMKLVKYYSSLEKEINVFSQVYKSNY
jgi:hypothetical protein